MHKDKLKVGWSSAYEKNFSKIKWNKTETKLVENEEVKDENN